MELIVNVFRDYPASVIAGVGLIVVGLLIYKYKTYWLIAGVNSLPDQKLKQMDLNYLSRSFGLFLCGFGFLQLLITAIFYYLKIEELMRTAHFASVFVLMLSIAVFAIVKRKRINW